MEEIFEVVDENDEIIGKATRKECHTNPNLIHRIVVVIVLNSEGKMYLKKRSMTKDLYKGMWEVSCSGHVDHGETYEYAAKRELEEELRIKDIQLKKISKFNIFDEIQKEIAELFICNYDGEIKLNLDEASEGGFFSIDAILSDLESEEKQFTLTSKLSIEEFLRYNKR